MARALACLPSFRLGLLRRAGLSRCLGVIGQKQRGKPRSTKACFPGFALIEATTSTPPEDVVPWGSGASRPGMACARSSEPWMAEPSDAPDPQGTAAPAEASALPQARKAQWPRSKSAPLPQARKAQRSPPKPAPLLQAQQTRRPRPEPKVIALDQIHGRCFPRLGENLSSVTVLRGACAAGQGPAPRAARWPQAPLSPPARTKAGRRSFTRCPAAGQPCMSTPRK